MATSGSTNFSVNFDEMAEASLRVLGVLGQGESLQADESTTARQAMNMMLKLWQADGMNVYLRKRATLFLQKDTNEYDLGPSGDHATNSYTSTAMRVAASTGATTLEVDSTAGMTAADYIGIKLDDGTIHWTTISSVTDSDTVVITTGLASAAAVDNKVYFYTTKVSRPIAIVSAFIRDGNYDYELRSLEYADYWRLWDKTQNSTPTAFNYDPQITNGVLRINYEPTDVTETFEFVYHRPIEDMDAGANDFDVPQEYYEPIKFGLAARLSSEYGLNRQDLWALSEGLYQKAKGISSDHPRRIVPVRF